MEGRDQGRAHSINEVDEGRLCRGAEQLEQKAAGDQDIDDANDEPHGRDGPEVVPPLLSDGHTLAGNRRWRLLLDRHPRITPYRFVESWTHPGWIAITESAIFAIGMVQEADPTGR